jgi:LysM repeat protein
LFKPVALCGVFQYGIIVTLLSVWVVEGKTVDMQQKAHTRIIGLLASLMLLVAAGCYQPAGSGFEQPITNSLPTFTPFPSPTVFVPPTVEPTDVLAILPTDTPMVVVPTVIAAVPTNTSTPVPVFPTAVISDDSAAIDALLTPQGTEVAAANIGAQPLPNQTELNPFEITATYIVGQATLQGSLPLTQTAAAVFGQPIVGATATPASLFPQPGVATPTPVPGLAQPVLSGADCIHEVQQTDPNLYRISLRYGVTVDQIARASGVANINLIYVGQQLTIPGCGTTGAVPPPTSIPTAGAAAAVGAQSASVGSGGGRIHIVAQNETLFELSLQYGVPVATIASANGISNINMIFIGQELVIP